MEPQGPATPPTQTPPEAPAPMPETPAPTPPVDQPTATPTPPPAAPAAPSAAAGKGNMKKWLLWGAVVVVVLVIVWVLFLK